MMLLTSHLWSTCKITTFMLKPPSMFLIAALFRELRACNIGVLEHEAFYNLPQLSTL